MLRGLDSPALRELAGTFRSDYQDARDIFYRVCEELGVQIPEAAAARWEFVYDWASAMTSGGTEPIVAASRIADEWQPLGRPSSLTVFVGLASQWDDDPEHRFEYERDMRAAAVELLQRRP